MKIGVASGLRNSTWTRVGCRLRWRTSRCVDALRRDLSRPKSLIGLHAQVLVIRGPVPWLALPKLLKRMPSIDTLIIGAGLKLKDDQVIPKIALVYPATLSYLTSVIMTASSPVLCEAYLTEHRFSSAKDLLPLLALFTRIVKVTLLTQVRPRSLEPRKVSSSKSVFDLDRVYIRYTSNLASAACLARLWQWPCTGRPSWDLAYYHLPVSSSTSDSVGKAS